MHVLIDALTLAAIFTGVIYIAVPPPDKMKEGSKPIRLPEEIVMVPRGVMGGNSHDRRLMRRRLERIGKLGNA
jgi:hypothetical protein